MNQGLKITFAAFLITAAGIKAAPAFAEPARDSSVAVSVVRTADLDLSSEHGRRQLDRRLVHAVREVCGTAADADLEGKNEVRKCRYETLAKAQAQQQVVLAAAQRGRTIAVTAAR